MRWFKLVLIVVHIPLFGQNITSIEYRPAPPISEKEITAAVGISFPVKASVFETDTVLARISRKLNSAGYLSHTVSSKIEQIDSLSSRFVVIIDAGLRATIKKINFLSSRTDSLVEGVRSLEFIEGNFYDEQELELVFAEILQNLEKKGYPFAQIKVNSVTVYKSEDSTSLYSDVNLTIFTNKKAIIDKIEISGNSSTSPSVILRELNIRAGDIYLPENNKIIAAKLNRLRFFEPVAQPEFYFNERQEGVLRITVKEANTNNFDGVIGYLPPGQNEQSGYLTGLVNINMRNLFGTGRNFSFKWQQLNRNSQELDLRYLEPWFLGLPLNISPRLYQRQQDTLYVDRILELTADYYTGSNFSISLSFASQSIIPTLFTTPVFTVYNSSILTGGVGLKYDTRDDPISPVSGINFYSWFSLSNKKIQGPKEFITPGQILQVNLRKIVFDFDAYFELFNRNIAAIGVSVREVQGDLIEESDLFRLGGNSTLRGYREEQFRGNRVAWSNIEYRFLTSSRSYLFAFFDAGYYLREGNAEKKIEETSSFKTGYGFGMSFETGIGLLSVSYALAAGEGFSDGKLHFGIINQF